MGNLPSVADVVAIMPPAEIDRAIRALTVRQRALLLDGDLPSVWAVTEDLERCFAALSTRAGDSRGR
ncbi:hypothetical protein ACWEQ4_12925 [Rhodococcus sp. NPDC003994]